jgi:rRNA maturation protein Nop10
MRQMRKTKDGVYTFKEEVDGEMTELPQPLKYSPDEKYASYRRKAKEPERKEKGLI